MLGNGDGGGCGGVGGGVVVVVIIVIVIIVVVVVSIFVVFSVEEYYCLRIHRAISHSFQAEPAQSRAALYLTVVPAELFPWCSSDLRNWNHDLS